MTFKFQFSSTILALRKKKIEAKTKKGPLKGKIRAHPVVVVRVFGELDLIVNNTEEIGVGRRLLGRRREESERTERKRVPFSYGCPRNDPPEGQGTEEEGVVTTMVASSERTDRTRERGRQR